jgi:hypothetical protein
VSGRQLGVVRDLLIDRDAGEAVMIDVDVPGTAQNAAVPIRVAQIDRRARVVLMDSADFGIVDATTSALPASSTEVVVDRRPVVEETVVRRRDAGAAPPPDLPMDDAAVLREREAERRRAERRRIDRMGTDL